MVAGIDDFEVEQDVKPNMSVHRPAPTMTVRLTSVIIGTVPLTTRSRWTVSFQVDLVNVTELKLIARLHHLPTRLWDFGVVLRRNSGPHC